MANCRASFSLLTFLFIITPLTSNPHFSGGEISLLEQPDEDYYIYKKKSAVITCQARNAVDIIFTCIGTQIPPSSVETGDMSDPTVIQAKIVVTSADVENSKDGTGKFWCECSALDVTSQVAVTSRRAYVSFANLKNKFLTQPESQTVTSGDSVEFACGAPVGQPVPEIMWRKDKKRLELEQNPRLFLTGNGTLIIEPVSAEDAGSYQCVARNLAGRRESREAQLTVTVLAESAEPAVQLSQSDTKSGKSRIARESVKASFIVEPRVSYTIFPGKTVQITCTAKSLSVITHRCNLKRLLKHRQDITQWLDSDGQRVIQSHVNITYEEVVQYIASYGSETTYSCDCMAWYVDTSTDKPWSTLISSKAEIIVAHLDNNFEAEPSDVYAGANTDATLVCQPPKGQPQPWVHWYKDESKLDPRSDNRLIVNSIGHLTIHRIQYSDTGVYYCVAGNEVGSRQSKRARLIVSEETPTTSPASTTVVDKSFDFEFPANIPSSPDFLQDLNPEYTLNDNGEAILICAMVSMVHLTVECQGARLRHEEYKQTVKTDTASGKRLISAKIVITAQQVASAEEPYTCQCAGWFRLNEAWEQVSGTRAVVKSRPAHVRTYLDDQFVVTPQSTTANFQDQAEFQCQPPEGVPKPTVYWLKNGDAIDPSIDSSYRITEDKLIIEYVRVEDEGIYICVAKNSAGSRQSSPVWLKVADKAIGEPVTTTVAQTTETPTDLYDSTTFPERPEFVMDLDNITYIASDQIVELQCKVSLAQLLVFVCNGNPVDSRASSFINPKTGDKIREAALNITSEQVENRPYNCLCRAYWKGPSDVLGQSYIDSTTTIFQWAYMADHFSLEPSDTQASLGERIELLCGAPDGDPRPHIMWLKDSQLIKADDRVYTAETGSLIIETFTRSDEGQYTCVAENPAEERKSQAARLSLKGEQVDELVPTSEFTPGKPDNTIQESTVGKDGLIYISKDLHAMYYLVKNKTVNILCEAYGVQTITFECGMQQMQDVTIKERVEEMQTIVEATLELTKTDFDDRLKTDYYCQCLAHYTDPQSNEEKTLHSQKGKVELASLKRKFQKEPSNETVEEGNFFILNCEPPQGNPPPKVTWLKEGEPLTSVTLTPEGGLSFGGIQVTDSGMYVCVAENDAGRRTSTAAFVEVKATFNTVSEGNSRVCTQILSSCHGLKSGIDPASFCKVLPQYISCLDKFEQKCTHISEYTLLTVQNVRMNAQKRCTAQTSCQQTSTCVSYLSLKNYQDVCKNVEAVVGCLNNALTNCLVPIETLVGTNSLEVTDWLNQFCSKFILQNTCQEINNCELNFGVPASNNTYWCNLQKTMLACVSGSITPCGLEALDSELEHLKDQVSCKKPTAEISTDGSKEVEPSAEGNSTPEEGTEVGGGGSAESSKANVDGEVKGKDLSDPENPDQDPDNKDEDEEMRRNDVSSSEEDNYSHIYNNQNSNKARQDGDNNDDDTGEENDDMIHEKGNKDEDQEEDGHAVDKTADVNKSHHSDDNDDEEEEEQDNMEKKEQDNMETEMEASKSGNGVSVVCISVLLASISQLLVTVILSWR